MLRCCPAADSPSRPIRLGGQITMVFPTLSLAIPQVKAGKLRVLAVTSDKRMATLSNVPTTAETGYAAVDATSWFVLVPPAQAPRSVLGRLNVEMAKVLKLAEVKERIEAQQGDILGNTPAEFSRFVSAEIANWTKVAKAGNIRAD